MKIGIVWENGVSKWMSQMFEPLIDIPGTDVNVFVGERNKFDVTDVKLKKHMLSHKEEILLGLAGLPASLKRVANAPYKKMYFYYNSLNKYLNDYDIIECADSSRSLYTLADLKRMGKGFKLIVSYAENIPYRQGFVFPSYPTMIWQEQFGMVLVEAMACGKPIIASAVGSIPEIIGDAGLTFVPGDFFEFAKKLALFMENRNLAPEVGQKGRRGAEEDLGARKNALSIYKMYRK